MSKDQLFLDPMRRNKSFEFDAAVTEVFEDMLKRSVPFYTELQGLFADFVASYLPQGGTLIDYGCSTGFTPTLLSQSLDVSDWHYIGIDSSTTMIDKACALGDDYSRFSSHDFMIYDLNDSLTPPPHHVALFNLTLQFIDPKNRLSLLKEVHDSLDTGGVVIVVEKVVEPHDGLQSFYEQRYFDFKRRQGYSDTEIEGKRQALKGVLMPLSYDENLSLIRQAGFRTVSSFFRWFNFVGFVGIK